MATHNLMASPVRGADAHGPAPSWLQAPPANLEAEQALLGALLANGRAYERVAEFLLPHHFADAVHGQIYAAIQRRLEAGQVADAISLRGDFEGSGVLAPAGGVAYLAKLLSAMVGIINAGEYGRVIVDCWLRRELIALGEDVVLRARGTEAGLEPCQVIEDAEAILARLGEGGNPAAQLVSAASAAEAALAAFEQAMASQGGLIGVDTGLRGVNRMTKGLRRAQHIVIGGRPAMGKTAFSGAVAYNAACLGHRVLFVTAEMGAADVMARFISRHAGVNLTEVLSGHDDDLQDAEGRPARLAQWKVDAVVAAKNFCATLPIEFETASSPSVPFIRARARRMQRQRGLDLIVVDYLQLLRASDIAARQSRNEAVSEISRGLKAIAKDLDVPVLTLSQLSRDNEKREGKRPQLSDLRDSGAIEQDADVVGFLHREHYYLSKNPPTRKDSEAAEAFEGRMAAWTDAVERTAGRGELILAKQRQGPEGIIRLRWNAGLTWFFDDQDHPAE